LERNIKRLPELLNENINAQFSKKERRFYAKLVREDVFPDEGRK